MASTPMHDTITAPQLKDYNLTKYRIVAERFTDDDHHLILDEYSASCLLSEGVAGFTNRALCFRTADDDRGIWIFITDANNGLPPGIEEINNIRLYSRMVVYLNQERYLERSNCFLLKSSDFPGTMYLEVHTSPPGHLEPVVHNYFINSFTMETDRGSDRILTVNTVHSETFFFIRTRLEVDRLVDSYPGMTVVPVEYFCIKNICSENILYGLSCVLLKSKTTTSTKRDYGGIEV